MKTTTKTTKFITDPIEQIMYCEHCSREQAIAIKQLHDQVVMPALDAFFAK